MLGALAFTATALAQHNVDPLTLGGTSVLGGTNNCPALATNVYDVVTVTRGQNAALQVQFTGPTSSTSNLVVRIDTSLDAGSAAANSSNTSSTNWFQNVAVFAIAASGTTQTTFVTNINNGAIGYWRVSFSNTNASGAFTNIVAKVANKPGI